MRQIQLRKHSIKNFSSEHDYHYNVYCRSSIVHNILVVVAIVVPLFRKAIECEIDVQTAALSPTPTSGTKCPSSMAWEHDW